MIASKIQKDECVVLGGGWNIISFSGSRASAWHAPPSLSVDSVSARAVCDHLNLDTLNESEEALDVCNERSKNKLKKAIKRRKQKCLD